MLSARSRRVLTASLMQVRGTCTLRYAESRMSFYLASIRSAATVHENADLLGMILLTVFRRRGRQRDAAREYVYSVARREGMLHPRERRVAVEITGV